MEMEVSESEAVFESLNFNPQLFINESLNMVADLVKKASDYYQREAPNFLETGGIDRAENLSKGIDIIWKKVEDILVDQLSIWEDYCHQHCFVVPEGFRLPKVNESSMDEDSLTDPQLDAEFDFWKNKLSMVEKEAEKLSGEVEAFENQCAKDNHFIDFLNEILQSFDQNSAREALQEMAKGASELGMGMQKLKSRTREEMVRIKLEKILKSNIDMMRNDKILCADLRDLEEFAKGITNVRK